MIAIEDALREIGADEIVFADAGDGAVAHARERFALPVSRGPASPARRPTANCCSATWTPAWSRGCCPLPDLFHSPLLEEPYCDDSKLDPPFLAGDARQTHARGLP